MRRDEAELAQCLAAVRFPIVELRAGPLNLTVCNSAEFGGLFGTPNAVHHTTPNWYHNPPLVASPGASISTQS